MAAPTASTASSSPERLPAAGIHLRIDPNAVLLAIPAVFGLLLYTLFELRPLAAVFYLSLQRWDGLGPQTFVGLANFETLAADSFFRTALLHSLLWAAGAAIGLTAVCLLAALGLRAAGSRGAVPAVLFFPALLPPAAVAAIWTLMYSPLDGLVNSALQAADLGALTQSWLGDPHLALGALFVAWAWSVLGVGTLVVWAASLTIDRDYLDLALVEGAGPLWRLLHVLLPALLRPLAVAALINLALAGQVFDLVFITTGGGPGYATMVLPVDMYSRAFGGAAGMGAAVAVVQVVIGVLPAMGAALLRAGGSEMHGGVIAAPAARGASRWAGRALGGLALIAALLPLVWLVAVALGFTGLTIGASRAGLDPRSWEWGAFAAAWNGGMSGALTTSPLLALAVTLLTLAAAVPGAALLRESGRIVRVGAAVLLLLGLFQPAPVLIVPLFSELRGWGLLDSSWGVILPEVARCLPFAVLLLWAFFAQLPADVLGAARIDGAGPLQELRHIVLPLSVPGLAAASVWAFLVSWNEYLLPTVVSQDGSLATVPTVLGTFIGRYDTQYPVLAAGSLLALLPALVIYLVLRRAAAGGLAGLERRAQ